MEERIKEIGEGIKGGKIEKVRRKGKKETKQKVSNRENESQRNKEGKVKTQKYVSLSKE